MCLFITLVAHRAAGQSDQAFSRDVYRARRARLLEQLGSAAVIVPGRHLVGQTDWVKQDPNFWYLTGVESPFAVLVITAQRTTLFLPGPFQFAGAQYPMADPAFRQAVWNRPVRRLVPGPEAVSATGVDETYPIDQLNDRLADLVKHVSPIYVPLDDEPLYAPPGLTAPQSVQHQIARSLVEHLSGKTVKDLTPILRRMRLVKDEHEIAALRKAAEISTAGLVEAMRTIKAGMNDREVAGRMEYVWKRDGSPRASFGPIVGSGPDSMTLFTLKGENYNPVDRIMRDGEMVFVDYGAAEYQMYTSDLCRTIPVSGRFDPDQRKYYDIVLEAQEAAVEAVKPGIMMLDVIKASAQVFRNHGLESFEDAARLGADHVWGVMPSPTHYLARGGGLVRYTAMGAGVRDLGHHIGLEAVEGRDFSEPLAPGMVFTVEPKIYIPDKQIAIMIEDMVLVTPTGHENLSAAAPKKAAEIESIMQAARRAERAGAVRE
jgi:Xaa-Pro aminopeptidase